MLRISPIRVTHSLILLFQKLICTVLVWLWFLTSVDGCEASVRDLNVSYIFSRTRLQLTVQSSGFFKKQWFVNLHPSIFKLYSFRDFISNFGRHVSRNMLYAFGVSATAGKQGFPRNNRTI